MTKRATSKYKINRRLGVNLWGRPKSPFNKREYGPGQHGQRRRKPSDFGTQLAAKQKLKGYYGNITERQFRRYYQEAMRRRGDTGEQLVQLLDEIIRLKNATGFSAPPAPTSSTPPPSRRAPSYAVADDAEGGGVMAVKRTRSS